MRQTIQQSPVYKWWVFGLIGTGSFMSVLDQTSLGVALPRISAHFATDLATVQWVVIGYALVISVLLLPMGRLGDMVDRKRVYVVGLVIFVLGAALSGSSQNIAMLIAARAFQGIGSAMIQGNAIAMVLSTFPGEERGKVLGSHLAVIGTGAVAGPAVGGLLVSALGWRSVFFMNAPFGIAVVAASILLLPPGLGRQPSDERLRFDWAGAALSGVALLVFLLVVGNGHRLGWTAAPILVGVATVILSFTAFVYWELRAPAPMVDVRLFTRRAVSLGITTRWISFLGTSSVIFLMPFYLQDVRGFSPREAGLTVIPGAACLAVVGAISGRLSDRFGWWRFTVAGLATSATALLLFSTTVTETSSVLWVIALIMLNSTGAGLFNSPNGSAILGAVEPSSYGLVAAMTQLTRNTANVTSIALTTLVVVTTMGSLGFAPDLEVVRTQTDPAVGAAFVTGLRRAYLITGSLLAVAVAMSLFNRERARAPAQEHDASPTP